VTALGRDDKGGRKAQEAVSYAVGHRIRVEILAALHEMKSASAKELARLVRQPLSTVTHHVGELREAGSIQVERTEKVRSVDQRFYATPAHWFASDEEMREETEEGRQRSCRVILESMMAEALAGFWAGRLTSDPRVFLTWTWFNVDSQGREEIADEQLRSWKRLEEIEARAAARREQAGEGHVSVVVSSVGFERARTAPGPPCPPRD
jgi:DNA-binding transcriptional ArsR family regulator